VPAALHWRSRLRRPDERRSVPAVVRDRAAATAGRSADWMVWPRL